MARVMIDIPDEVLSPSKSLQTLTHEVREALTLYWLARGELSLEQATQWHNQQKGVPSFWQWVTSMPNVGTDDDFARLQDLGRTISLGDED